MCHFGQSILFYGEMGTPAGFSGTSSHFCVPGPWDDFYTLEATVQFLLHHDTAPLTDVIRANKYVVASLAYFFI